MKRILVILFSLVVFHSCGQELSKSPSLEDSGSDPSLPKNMRLIENMSSKYVSARNVYIRLPHDYDQRKSYPVLYMHDGQMLFSYQNTWNGQDWGTDETILKLVDQGDIQDVIVVGVANVAAERHSNYFPEKPFLALPVKVKDSLADVVMGDRELFGIPVNSDDYLKFLVYELKPYIDSNYTTKRDLKNTFIAGSSMGGLISMYAFFEYPEVFGGAACLSTHWIGGFAQNRVIPEAFQNYIGSRKELAHGRKIYFDTGTETLDAFYGPHLKAIDSLFLSSPELGEVYLSRTFEGAGHTEDAWKERFNIPLKFLLQTD